MCIYTDCTGTITISRTLQQVFITPGIEKSCYRCEINGVISPVTVWQATNPATRLLEAIPVMSYTSYGTVFDGVLGIYSPENYVQPGNAGKKQLLCSTSSGSINALLLSPGEC